MAEERSRGVPMWLWGAICAILLILLSIWGHLAGTEALRQVFAAQPIPAGFNPQLTLPKFELGTLPTALQQPARNLLTNLGAGNSGQPVESFVTTPRLRVVVRELRPTEGGLLVVGEVTNISQGDVAAPISAFELRDSAGVSYIAGGGASATLKPGEHTPLELTVPLPTGRGLILITNLPPDAPVEQRLIVIETKTP